MHSFQTWGSFFQCEPVHISQCEEKRPRNGIRQEQSLWLRGNQLISHFPEFELGLVITYFKKAAKAFEEENAASTWEEAVP